jgi:hypothetical protein
MKNSPLQSSAPVGPVAVTPAPVIEYRIGHYGDYIVYSNQLFEGRGVKLWGDGSSHARGLRCYRMSEAAFKKHVEPRQPTYTGPEYD